MSVELGGWVYMLANRPEGTLYVGVTADLARRAYEHRERTSDGFTKRYNIQRLVWIERHDDIRRAIQREEHQALAAGLESRADRRRESGVEGPVRGLDEVTGAFPTPPLPRVSLRHCLRSPSRYGAPASLFRHDRA